MSEENSIRTSSSVPFQFCRVCSAELLDFFAYFGACSDCIMQADSKITSVPRPQYSFTNGDLDVEES